MSGKQGKRRRCTACKDGLIIVKGKGVRNCTVCDGEGWIYEQG